MSTYKKVHPRSFMWRAPKSKRLRQKRDFSFSPLKWSRISTDTFSAHRISDEFSPHGFFWKRGRKSGQIKNATIWRKTRPAIFSGLKHTHSNDDFQTLVRVGKPLFSLLGSSYLVQIFGLFAFFRADVVRCLRLTFSFDSLRFSGVDPFILQMHTHMKKLGFVSVPLRGPGGHLF